MFISIIQSYVSFTSEISLGAASHVFFDYAHIISTELILLIILYEVASTSKLRDKSLDTSLMMGVFSLLCSFFAIGVFRIIKLV
jgi:hypothetical protein